MALQMASRPVSSQDSWAFCQQILPDVSRSFALIIPRCPAPIDGALCVGYLLCRVADTIEDEPTLNDAQRARLYDSLLAAVDQPACPQGVSDFRAAWPTLPDGPY